MAKAVNRSVNIFIESGEAEKAQQRLSAKAKQLQDDLKKATDPVVINRLTKELKTTEGQLDRVTKKVNGEVAPSFKDLQNTVNALGRRLKTMSTTDADFSKVLIQYQKAKVELAEMKGRVDQLDNGFKNSAKSSSGFLNGIAGFAKGVGALAAAQISIEGITSLIGGSIEEFKQAELTAARFEARLKNLGQSDAVPRLTRFAEQLADQFKFLDNDDIIAVFEQFINYGKLTEQQIRDLTPVVIDFAAQQQISVQEAGAVIVKALEGNGKALKEYGIDIKDAGNETEAFGIIMDELRPKVEGAAATFSQTLAGSAAETRQEIANLKEEIGENLQPVVRAFYKTLAEITGTFRRTLSADVGFFTKVLALSGNLRAQAKVNAAAALAEIKAQEAAADDLQEASAYSTLGIKSTTGGNKKTGGTTGKSAAQIAREKEAEEEKKRIELLKQLNEEYYLSQATELTKGLFRIEKYYDDVRSKAKFTAEELSQIDELEYKARVQYLQEYYDKVQKEADKNAAELRQKSEAEAKRIKDLFEKRQLAALDFARKTLEDKAEQGFQNLRDDAELKVMQSRGFQRMKALREQLDLEEEYEVQAAIKAGESVEKVREEYRQKRIQQIQEQILEITDVIQQGLKVVTDVFNAISERENQRLDDNRRRYDREREAYRNLLDDQKISKEEANKRIAAIDRKQEAEEKALRRKQFERDKALSLTNAIINTAVAVTKVIPNPLLMALAAAFGAVQIGIIASQKPPQFAKGGILKGPRHSNGGMPVMNPVTGTVEAEVEGGEAILSRNFVRNNPNLVAAALESSRNGGYNIESPFNRTALKPMNVGLINQSIGNVRRYESGGILPQQTNPQLQQENQMLREVLMRLSKQLDKPFVGVVSLTSIEDANDRKQAIIADATMR